MAEKQKKSSNETKKRGGFSFGGREGRRLFGKTWRRWPIFAAFRAVKISGSLEVMMMIDKLLIAVDVVRAIVTERNLMLA